MTDSQGSRLYGMPKRIFGAPFPFDARRCGTACKIPLIRHCFTWGNAMQLAMTEEDFERDREKGDMRSGSNYAPSKVRTRLCFWAAWKTHPITQTLET